MRNLEIRNSRSWRAAAQTRGKIAPTEFAENAEGHIRLQVEPFTRSPCLPSVPWATKLGFVPFVHFVVPFQEHRGCSPPSRHSSSTGFLSP